MTIEPTGKRAIVIGGSLGGLFVGILLRSIGWQSNSAGRSRF
jgi:2-polyprenyl-6-methoxyphenol hydroxylase-like FAD-dependent oxidoreductase